jgi:serine protease AprX
VRAFRRPARVISVAVTSALLTLSTQLAGPTAHAVTAAPLAPVSAQVARDLAMLPASTPYGVYANVRGGTAATRAALMVDHGLNVIADYPSVGAVFGVGTLGAAGTLRRDPSVSYLSTNRALRRLDDTSGWATRVEQVQRSVGNGPYRSASGHVLDGTGIGVAVVDSGIDGTHPDLANRIVRNTKYLCTTPLLVSVATGGCATPMVNTTLTDTDAQGGHGSHVAGIVAGDGTSSHGTFRGVAPGASLYGYSVGDGDSIWTSEVNAAFQDVLTTNASGANTPPIRIVTNSWGDGAGTAYDPNDVTSQLTRALISSGVTVLFAAGNGDTTNNGGDGSDDRLSSTAKDPTPGVITVANYDDAATGTRNGTLDSSSSRGWKGHPTDYPDISAPGANITSTCRAAQPICAGFGFPSTEWAPYYTQLSGTSMATPHVAGIVALLLQARPDLKPAAVETLLQDTAYRFGDAASYEADPQNVGGKTSFDKGAGLADAQAALDQLGVAHDGGDAAQGEPQVTIGAPADGAVSDGTAPLAVSGTATDGYVAPKPFVNQVIATGDGGDLPSPAPGDEDITDLSVIETATGMRFTLTVRNLSDPNSVGDAFVTRETVNGVERSTEVAWDGTAASPGTDTNTLNTAPPSNVTWNVAANTISWSITFAQLGNPGPMSPAYKVYVANYQGYPVDLAPGGTVAPANVKTQPEYGAFTIRRPSLAGPPATSVTLSVDGGAANPVAVTGSTPSYSWSSSIATTDLAEGQHTLTATALINGIARASRTVAFTVTRPVVVVSSIGFASPADGALVDRGIVTASGTSTTNAPAAQVRRVTLQIQGAGYDSGELTADGTSAWSTPFDAASLAGGSYLLTARLYLDGAVAATATRGISVPAPVVLVSCAPRALSFWQNQFNGNKKAVYTAAEADALSAKAATLSNGYFTKSALVAVLYANGKLPAETIAARQYAPLLLNLAAGQLSATMSNPLGLSGKETLSSSVYDTAKVGTTVTAAAGWIRAQFSSGDLAKAEQTAININNRSGLGC